MDKKSVLKRVSRFKKSLESKGIKVDRMLLFGSCAKGTQKEGSDIDVVVISESLNGKGYWERIQILSDAIYEIFEPIEAVAMTPEEWDKANLRRKVDKGLEDTRAGRVVPHEQVRQRIAKLLK